MSARRWLGAMSIVLATALPSTSAAQPAGGDEAAHTTAVPTATVAVEVRTGTEISEAEDLRRWIHQEAQAVLATLPAQTRYAGTIEIDVEGSLYDYRVTLTARRGSEAVGAPVEWACECSNEDFLRSMHGELPRAMALLERPQEEPEQSITEQAIPVGAVGDVGAVDQEPPRQAPPLGTAGTIGIGLVAVGVVGVATGITLSALGERKRPGPPFEATTTDFSPPGTAVAIAGAGLVLSGGLLLLLRRSINGRGRSAVDAIAPSVDAERRVTVALTGRF